MRPGFDVTDSTWVDSILGCNFFLHDTLRQELTNLEDLFSVQLSGAVARPVVIAVPVVFAPSSITKVLKPVISAIAVQMKDVMPRWSRAVERLRNDGVDGFSDISGI